MGVISRMTKSGFFSAASGGCRRMISCYSSLPSSSSRNNSDLLLVKRFSRETKKHYFSLISTENGVTVRDFHSPYFGDECSGFSTVRGSNGLLLLHTVPNDKRIWNPWTNEFKLLPPSYVPRPPNKYSYTITRVAFGFDSKSRDFKVLRLVRNYFEPDRCDPDLIKSQSQIELYSLNNDSWKEIFADPSCPYLSDFSWNDLFSNHCTYANGRCYWRIENRNILCFDFANESFSCFSLPEISSHHRSSIGEITHLVEFDGLLGAIISHVHDRLVGELWIWNDESWTRKFVIHAGGEPLMFSRDNRLLFLRGPRLLVYEVSSQDVKKFDINGYRGVFPYFDSEVDFKG